MAIQEVHNTTHQANSSGRQTIDRVMNNIGQFVGNFLIQYWATMITCVLGILVFAALSVPFLSYFGLDAISKQIFFALHMVCAQIPITLVLHFWTSTGYVCTQLLHICFHVCW